MKLSAIALKNLKRNFSFYFLYLFSVSFVLMIYFCFTSFSMNQIIMEKISSDGRVETMCRTVAVFIMVFVIFYMFYSNSFFMRRRMRELGIYSLLGYRKSTILKLLIFENVMICFGGMILGILTGSILHKIVIAGIVTLLGISVDQSSIPLIYPAAVKAILSFVIVVLITLTLSNARLLRKSTLLDLVRLEKKTEKPIHPHAITAILGVGFLSAGYGLALDIISKAVSMLLLPVCFYQSAYFIQTFLFQGSAYRGQKALLAFLKISCVTAIICFFFSDRAFFTAYQLQFFISTLALAVVGIIQRKRIVFVLKSQRKRLLFPLALVVIPFVIYLFVFHREAEYMASMGSYIPVMLAFVCIHSIVFQYHPQQVQFLTLSGGYIVALVFVGLVGLVGMAYLFQIPLVAILMSVYIVVLMAQVYNILLYVRICRQPTDYNNPTDRQHFYAYSLEQIKREENLKKDFSNYLHDNILQNLLSIKNMLCKAEQPEIRRLLLDTLTELNASIRFQMQTYHPNLVKSLTLKENIQNLLDSMEENHSANICLDCDKDVFLVEPYNVLIYRMIKELVTNALKHSSATTIDVLLMQEDGRITLKVTDNGIGFKPFTYKSGSHQGLASIGEQVSLLDGTMNIQPATGGGTAVVISMPMNGGDSYENFVGR